MQNYCGVENSPIWGEVQHSLWLDVPNWKLTRDKYFSRNFIWNSIIPIPNGIPIGDPWNYLKSDFSILKNLKSVHSDIYNWSKDSYVLLIPQHTGRQELLNEKVLRHETLLNEAICLAQQFRIIVLLHPTEEASPGIKKVYLDKSQVNTIQLLDRSQINASMAAYLTQELFKNCNFMITNYFGAHSVRCALQKSKIEFVNLTNFFQRTTDLTEEIRQDFIHNPSNRENIANELLGTKFKKEPWELSKILGFTGLKKIFGRHTKKVHNLIIYK